MKSYLVGEVESHGPGRGEGTDAEREQLGSQEVLHGVPAESPTETRDVDHGDGATASGLLVGRKNEVVDNTKLGHGSEETSDVDHRQSLKSDTGEQSALATNNIDQEQRAGNGSNELDDTEDGRDEQTLGASGDADESEQVGGVESDGTSTGPLRQELDHGRQVETVEVALVEEHLLHLASPAHTLGSLKLSVQSHLNFVDVVDNVLARGVLLPDLGEDHGGLLDLALLHQVARRLELEECQDEGDAGEHDVQAGRDKPLVVAAVADVEAGAVVGEVGEDNTDVDGTGEKTGAETTDGGGSDLGEVDGTDDGGHADTEATDEATSVDSTELAIDTRDHEDGDTESPDRGENTGSPDTSDTIADEESTRLVVRQNEGQQRKWL